MKHLFIVNPVAGGKDRHEYVAEQARLALEGSADAYEVYVTTAPMDACAKIAAEAASGEELRVYACGGDGTLNECVNGAVGHANVAVTHFPCGTGNDFIKMFGEEKARFFDLAELVRGEVRPFDVMECCGRYAVNICSVGIDARIGTEVHQYHDSYVLSAVANLFKGIAQPLTVRGCGMEYSGGTSLICACNGRFYGGGFNPVPEAEPDERLPQMPVCKRTHNSTPSNSSISSSDAAAQSLGYPAQAVPVCASSSSSSMASVTVS